MPVLHFPTLLIPSQVREDCAPASHAEPLYRDWSAEQSDHFYTNNKGEADVVLGGQFVSEGIAALVFPGPIPGGHPITRLLNLEAQDHMLSGDPADIQNALSLGYMSETDDFADPIYMYSTQVCGSVPMFRLYSATATDHFYTTDAAERDAAIAGDSAYVDEGALGYVLPADAAAAAPPGTTAAATTSTTAEATKPTTTAAAGDPKTTTTPVSGAPVTPTKTGTTAHPTTTKSGSVSSSEACVLLLFSSISVS
ncbi:hypothetical protein DFH09DRAFT_934859 [Mycena vulgaris]|nr:hypothetical protein DFH09DRAFT_934859 [Mycena vulgaris]